MLQEQASTHINKLKRKVQISWLEGFDRNEIEITVIGLPAISPFSINNSEKLEIKTRALMTWRAFGPILQRALKRSGAGP